MITQAFFDNIQSIILNQIDGAKESIHVAVAWITDSEIFNLLCQKADHVYVELLLVDDQINNSRTNYEHRRLKDAGGYINLVPVQANGSIMHHKFCVIDGSTVITGSYNWSNRAKTNDENIIVTEQAEALGEQFLSEFESIKRRISKNQERTETTELQLIRARLEILQRLIFLRDEEIIINQAQKIRKLQLTDELKRIVNTLLQKEYTSASEAIESYLNKQSEVILFEDADIFSLQLEIKTLEIELNAFLNEKIELEKMIQDFLNKQNTELGELLLQLLALKKNTAQNEKERKEAEDDEKKYRQGYDQNLKASIPLIGKEEKQLLSKVYREASLLCHPDRFANESFAKQKEAETMFKELSAAYKTNNLMKVNQILSHLKLGILTQTKSAQIERKELLLARQNILKSKIEALFEEIESLKHSAIYQMIMNIPDWDSYFMLAKLNFQEQIEALLKLQGNGKQ